MNVIQKKLSEIVPYAKNAKKHDKKQIANVAESIKQYGFVQPVVIDRDGVIVIGHCRAEAAKKLGMKTVPCVCVDDLTPEQVNALRLVDNKSNESAWDMDLLAEELPELDLSAFDFDWGLRDELDDSVIEDNYEPVLPAEPLFDYQMQCSSKPGENVLDLFAGSGTTIMAAEQNGRHAFCMEYDPKYADVIVDRWEKFIGKKAVLVHDD